MEDKKGQIATEYLVMTGVMLIIIAILAGYGITVYTETVSINQTKDSLEDLKLAANWVYALGEGNSVVVKIILPYGVTDTSVVGKAIYVNATSFGSSYEDFVETDANLHGSIPTSPGIHHIEVRAVDGNVSLNET